jgi:hypothetical protein
MLASERNPRMSDDNRIEYWFHIPDVLPIAVQALSPSLVDGGRPALRLVAQGRLRYPVNKHGPADPGRGVLTPAASPGSTRSATAPTPVGRPTGPTTATVTRWRWLTCR